MSGLGVAMLGALANVAGTPFHRHDALTEDPMAERLDSTSREEYNGLRVEAVGATPAGDVFAIDGSR